MAKKTFKEYKPITIADTFATSSIQNIVSEIYSDKDKTINENLFLFHGESGSGKTLASRIIAADVFKLEDEERRDFINRLELNDNLSMHFETINGASHNKVDDARAFDDKLSDIENSMGLSDIPYVFMIDEVDTFTTEAMKAYLTALDRIKDGKIPNAYVFMTTSRVKKLTDEFLRRFLVVEFGAFKRFEQTDRFITYQLEKNKIPANSIDEQIRKDIHFASGGAPGFIVNNIKHYLLSGTVPEDPEKDHTNASDILKTVLRISVEMNEGKVQSVPKLKRLLDSLHAKTGNWEAVRIAIMATVYYTLDEHSEEGKLTTSGFNILNEYLKILVPFTVETKLGKYEILSRCMSMSQARYKIMFAKKPSKTTTTKTGIKGKEE